MNTSQKNRPCTSDTYPKTTYSTLRRSLRVISYYQISIHIYNFNYIAYLVEQINEMTLQRFLKKQM